MMIPRRLLAVEALPLTGDYHLLEVLPKGRDYHLLEAPPGTTATVKATPTSTVATAVADIPLTGDHHLLEAPPGNTTTVNTTTANATSPTTSTAVAAPACTSTDGQTWPSKECCSRQLARRRHCRATVAPTGMGAVTTGSLGAAAARRGGDPNRVRRRGALREAARARAAAARRARGRSGSSRNSSGCVAPHAAPNATAFGCGSVSGWRAALACLAAPRGGFCMAAHGCMASSWRVDDLTPGRRAALVVAPETAVPQSCFDVSQPRSQPNPDPNPNPIAPTSTL